MKPDEYLAAFHAHVGRFFAGHSVRHETFTDGPILAFAPTFHVLVVEPGPRTSHWTYVSAGAALVEMKEPRRLEFCFIANRPSSRHVELLAMVTHYHATERLGVGHTLPIGEPWVRGSKLEHLLVSLPYPFGRDFELLPRSDGDVRVLWLLPISHAERDFKVREGWEALEARFDEARIDYWDPYRRSEV